MWEIRIEPYRKQPEIVTISALDTDSGFAYSEENYPEKFVIEDFVREAIARRDKWASARDASMQSANSLVQDIFIALNKTDGVKEVELSLAINSNSVQCSQKVVEPIKEGLMTEDLMGTATGLRISAVALTALLGNCPADILAAAGTGAQVKIYPAAAPTHYLQGFIGTVGSSEGLSDILTIDTLNFTVGWSKNTGINIDNATTFTSTNGILMVYQTVGTLMPYALYKTSYTGTNVRSGILTISGNAINEGGSIQYKTNKTAYTQIAFQTTGSVTTQLTALSIQQVIAPSSSGCLITSTLGGTQSWTTNNFAAADYNLASYSYEIILPGGSGILAGNILNGEILRSRILR